MRNPVRSTRWRGDTQSEGDNGDAQAVDGPTVREKEERLNNNDDDDDESDGSGAYKPADNSELETETRPSDSPATTTTKSTVSKKPKSAKVKLSKKRRRHSTEDNDNDHGDKNNSNNGDDGDRGGRKRRRRSEMEEFREFQREPILPVIDSMLSREQKAAAEIALLALDGRQDGETYRWPVREDLIPVVPSVPPEITNEPSAFEQYGMGFVDELTGVPKEEADYSDIDEDLLDGRSDALQGLSEVGLQERLLHRKRLNKRRKERQANERMSNSRLEQVHHFLESEVTLFARTQYRKGSRDRVKDLYKFQQETLPPFRIQAARAPVGSSRAGEEQEDELTTIQEKAVAFAAEDSLRKVLDRLPYVIRQGALGEAPDYVTLGLPKPVASAADYERGWDTMMAAASIAGIDDRILKKVGLRMKTHLSLSRQSRYYEAPPKATFATADDSDDDTAATLIENNGDDERVGSSGKGDRAAARSLKVFRPSESAVTVDAWQGIPRPLHLAHEFVDPMDPKYSAEARRRRARKVRAWICKDIVPEARQC